ncbi:ribonuclease H-like domain-containing protein [Tanacetum coccineum]
MLSSNMVEPTLQCLLVLSNDKQTSASTSSGFTSEHMQKLLSLINDSPSSSMHANMAGRASFFNGAYQHLTVSTVGMFNVVDITSLNITIGHPNGTLATISHVGNLRLTNNIVLYDVLVVPGYRNLKKEKILETGSEFGGLYLFDMIKDNFVDKFNMVMCFNVSKLFWHNRLGHPSDQVLSVLHQDLDISKSSTISACEVCHKAKQTMDPFPLSSHISKHLGELVHLDFWGPYRVPSREGFKYFLTIVDDYSRAVWVYLIKTKDEVFDVFLSFINFVHNQFDVKIKTVRSDNGTEFVNSKMSKVFSDLGGIPLRFWSHCVLTVVYLINMLPFLVFKDYASDTEYVTFFDNQTFQSPNDDGRATPVNVMNNDIEALNRNNTWTECDLPSGRKPIGSKWIWKIKYKASSKIEMYKARLAAKGFSQKEGFDYDETFSLVVKMVTIRCLVSMAVVNGYNSESKFKVCKLNNSLYGLKQALRQWNAKLTTALHKDVVFVTLLVYVDDIVIIGNDEVEINNFKKFLSSKFLIKDLARHVSIPFPENIVLNHVESKDDKYLNNFTSYQKLVGKLIYLTNTRTDISYVVHCLSQHMHSPLQSHMKAALRVLRYLKGSPRLGTDKTKNHKKTVKNGQTRIREWKSAQEPEAKVKKSKLSVNYGSTKVNHKKTKDRKVPNQSFKFQKITQMVLEV